MIARIDLRPVSPRLAWRYWLRNATVFRRTYPLSLLAWFIEPVLYLVAMGLGLGRYLQQIEGIDYIEFIAPGLLATSGMYGATFESTWNTFFKMERSRVYHACLASPLSVEDVAFGEFLWSTTRGIMYGTAFAIVAVPFGVFRSWWALGVLPVLVLVTAMFAVTGLAFTYLTPQVDYLAFYWTLYLTPMFMFAGIFFPLERLPEWLQALAWLMPLHHAVDAFRALMLHGDPVAALGPIAWMTAFTAALSPLPLALLRRRLLA